MARLRNTERRPANRDALAATVADLRGLLQLGVAGTVGVATLAEAVHRAVLSTAPLPWLPGPLAVRAIGGVAFAGVRGVAGAVGKGGDALLGLAQRKAEGKSSTPALRPTPVPLAVRAVLNGVIGDRLEAMGNPLALPMTIEAPRRSRLRRRPPQASGERVLFVHGLCMSDEPWQEGEGVCLGARVFDALGHRPLYLRYGTGLPILENGRRLAALLERRHAGPRLWTGGLHLVAHSLGGLVVRSAIAEGLAAGHAWPTMLRNVVFLGTPHGGAPLERFGTLVERGLSISRFSAPWMALGRLRSVAIRQLGRASLPPLGEVAEAGLENLRFHAVAGTLARRSEGALVGAVGDGLVPVDSALALRVPPATLRLDTRKTVAGAGHLAMIRHPEVADHLLSLFRD